MSYYFGQGKVYLGKRVGANVPGGYIPIGNCPSLVLVPGRAAERYAVADGETPPALSRGGDLPSVELEIEDFSKENFEKALYGKKSTVAGTTVVNETVVAVLGATIPVVNMNIATWTSLTHSTGAPTYVNGTDYTVNLETGSINFPATGSAIADLQSLRANYTFAAYDRVGGFTVAQPYWRVRFEGFNILTAGGKKPVIVDMYKVRLMPADSLPVISGGLANLRMSGRMQYDIDQADVPETGRFFKIMYV